VLVMTNPWKAGSIGSVFYSLKQLCCFFFNNRDGATKGVLRTPFSSFYVAHLAQPNESSRRRVVAVIKNDWAQPNPKWFKTEPIDPAFQGLVDNLRKSFTFNNKPWSLGDIISTRCSIKPTPHYG
jgi:hypothetical protein